LTDNDFEGDRPEGEGQPAEPRQRDSRSAQRRGDFGGSRAHGGQRRRGRKVCAFCADQATSIDYKDLSTLTRYVNERGRILPRRRTGTCAKHQRCLSQAIKRARHLALIPYAAQHVREI